MIRLANLSDVVEIYEAVNNTPEERDFADGEEYPMCWVKDVIENKDENIVLVYEEDKKLVGFLIAHILASCKDAIMNNLYVKPEYRGKGIATKITKEYETIVRSLGIDFSMSLVHVDNDDMQKLSEKVGYSQGEKCYVYYKWLK